MSVLSSLGWRKLSFSFHKAMLFIPHKVTRSFDVSQVKELAILFGLWNVGIPRFSDSRDGLTYFYIRLIIHY